MISSSEMIPSVRETNTDFDLLIHSPPGVIDGEGQHFLKIIKS